MLRFMLDDVHVMVGDDLQVISDDPVARLATLVVIADGFAPWEGFPWQVLERRLIEEYGDLVRVLEITPVPTDEDLLRY